MAWKSEMRVEHLEPPPWLYARMASGSLMRLIYRLFVGDLARTASGARVLDVGTGPGYLLTYLSDARDDLSLWGLDFSWEMIRRARARQAIAAPQTLRWLVANACHLPFPAGVFDQVVATFSFHIWPCPTAGLKELKRVLAPGGRAWVYELRREATIPNLKAFAQKIGLPFPLVFLGFKIVSRHHAVPVAEFTQALGDAAGSQGTLNPIHKIFWRAELTG